MFRRNPCCLLRGLLLASCLLLASQPGYAPAKERAAPPELRAQIDSAIAKVKPALVRIRVVSTDYSEGRETKIQAVGSGVIITRDGYLITNHHVAGHAARIFCTLWNREEIEAELVGTDPLTDIAVVRLTPQTPVEFKTAGFGDSSKVRVANTCWRWAAPWPSRNPLPSALSATPR